MTPLAARLAQRIAQSGPIPVAQFMAAALNDPEFGYYRRRMPFGADGDFITAPDISQMFGELIGLWCVAVFEQMGQPLALRLVELGPGRGSLMADLWRAAAIRPAFRSAAKIHLVDVSPVLRDRQKAALRGIDAAWHESFVEMASGAGGAPLIVIANEFFDALPIHQLEQTASGWRERIIAFDPASQAFFFKTSAEESAICAEVPAELRNAAPGSIFEVSIEGRAMIADIASEIMACRGAALVIDYGHAPSAIGETLQAVRAHRYHDVLADLGLADITAHVDFAALMQAAASKGVRVFGPLPQGEFLCRLGIEPRAETLAAAHPERAEEISAGLHRLIDGDQMGSLFKTAAVTDPSLSAPAFDSAARA